MDNNYIAQRLVALGNGNDAQKEMDALRAENARLKERLGASPQVTLKSEAQKAFEQSPEFEQLLNIFCVRFLRDRFMPEFQASPYNEGFQAAANAAFTEYEKREVAKDGQTRAKAHVGTSKTDAGKDT